MVRSTSIILFVSFRSSHQLTEGLRYSLDCLLYIYFIVSIWNFIFWFNSLKYYVRLSESQQFLSLFNFWLLRLLLYFFKLITLSPKLLITLVDIFLQKLVTGKSIFIENVQLMFNFFRKN